MKVFVRIACIAWLQTGHHGKIDDSTLKERLHYLISIRIFLFAFAVSEEKKICLENPAEVLSHRHYDSDFCGIRMSSMSVGCSLSQDNSC
jgi:hypothetical protein